MNPGLLLQPIHLECHRRLSPSAARLASTSA